MTTLLHKAVTAAERLSEAEQDFLGQTMLEAMESEQRWEELFATSQDALAKLGEQALAEHRAGRTVDFDPDRAD